MKKMFLALFPLLFLASCALNKTYELPSLPVTQSTSSPFQQSSSVSFAYHVFNKADCKKYLDKDFISKGYVPIHFTLVNSSKQAVYFSRKNINMQTLDSEEVRRAVCLKVGSGPISRLRDALLPVCWPFVIPFLWKFELSDFSHIALKDQRINPYSSINGLVFVSAEACTDDFQIVLHTEEVPQRIVLSTENPRVLLCT